MSLALSTILRPDDHYRPANWLWELVLRTYERQEATRRAPGQYERNLDLRVQRGVAFLRRWRRLEDTPGCNDSYDRLYDEYKDLYLAHLLYSKVTNDVLYLEALLCGGQTNVSIAAETSIPEDAVQAYHTYFFDVRDRLESEAFIRNVVISPARGNIEEHVFWKSMALERGPKFLRRWCRKFTHYEPDEQAEADLLMATNVRKLAISATLNPFHMPETRSAHVASWIQTKQCETAASMAGNNTYDQIRGSTQEIQVSVGGFMNNIQSARQVAVIQGGIEPRALLGAHEAVKRLMTARGQSGKTTPSEQPVEA